MSISKKTILILGGYGHIGSVIAQLLVRETPEDTSILLAGRNLVRAVDKADHINALYKTNRVAARRVDASSSQACLTRAFQHADLVVVALLTTEYANNIIEAAVDAGINYFDIQASMNPAKKNILESSRPRMEESGCYFVTRGGFHPGTPAALVRYVYETLCQEIHIAKVFVVSRPKTSTIEISIDDDDDHHSDAETREELHDSIRQDFNHDGKSWSFTSGQWQQQRRLSLLSRPTEYNFGKSFGMMNCRASKHTKDELQSLPTIIPTLQEMGIQVAGSENPTADALVGNSKSRRSSWILDVLCQDYMLPSLEDDYPSSSSALPSGSLMVLQGEGMTETLKRGNNSPQEEEEKMRFRICLSHTDSQFMTAASSVACVLQLLNDHKQKTPGLYQQGDWVEPRRFFHDLQRMGVSVKESFVTL